MTTELTIPSGIPSLPINNHPLLADSWSRFLEQLKVLDDGVVVSTQWERLMWGDRFDFDDEQDVGILGVVASIVPDTLDLFTEYLMPAECDDECERREGQCLEHEDEPNCALILVTGLREIVGVEGRPAQLIIFVFEWDIDGCMSASGGSVIVRELDDEWCAVTTRYDRESFADHIPHLLGFVKRGQLLTGVTAVVRATIGGYISRPTRIRWQGMSAAEAVRIAINGLGRYESEQHHIDEQALDDWSLQFTDNAVDLGHLPKLLLEHAREKALLAELEARFDSTLAARRTREVVHPPLDRRIDALTDEDWEVLTRWFALERGQRLRGFGWWPNGMKYCTRNPTVTVSIDGPGEPRYLTFDGTQAPTVGEVIERLSRPENPLPLCPEGGGTVAQADTLWAQGFCDEAGKLYGEVAQSNDYRARLAVVGHLIAAGQLDQAREVASSLDQRFEEMRQEAASEVRASVREGKFLAALSLKRDILRAFVVIYIKGGEVDHARSTLGEWRGLVAELGEGPDPFAAP